MSFEESWVLAGRKGGRVSGRGQACSVLAEISGIDAVYNQYNYLNARIVNVN